METLNQSQTVIKRINLRETDDHFIKIGENWFFVHKNSKIKVSSFDCDIEELESQPHNKTIYCFMAFM